MTTALLPKPCAKCPFRAEFKGDGDFLRPGRRGGIVKTLLADGQFPCHNTVDYENEPDPGDEYEHVRGADEIDCAGAALVMLRAERSTQMLRIMERLGMVDLDEFVAKNADVELWTLREALDETLPDVTVEMDDGPETEGVCDVVNSECEAPAGYMIGGEVVHGEDFVDTRCPECGEFVCDACSDDEGRCLNGMCSDQEEDDDYDY